MRDNELTTFLVTFRKLVILILPWTHYYRPYLEVQSLSVSLPGSCRLNCACTCAYCAYTEEGDESDDDDEILVGGRVQDYKCPITLTILVDPVTS